MLFSSFCSCNSQEVLVCMILLGLGTSWVEKFDMLFGESVLCKRDCCYCALC